MAIHISAVLYVLIGAACLIYGPDVKDTDQRLVLIISGWFALVFAVAAEFIVRGLKRQCFWAWGAGLVIGGMYALSIFLPMGLAMLWGLANSEAHEFFKPEGSKGA